MMRGSLDPRPINRSFGYQYVIIILSYDYIIGALVLSDE